MKFVVDASVALKWVFKEDGSSEALALAAQDLIAPELFPTECANGLWKACRRKELSEDEAHRKLVDLLKGGVAIHGVSPDEALLLGAELNHSVYDCTYLALAIAESAPVVTSDDRFARKVEAAGLSRHLRRLDSWRSP